jgi:LysM domain
MDLFSRKFVICLLGILWLTLSVTGEEATLTSVLEECPKLCATDESPPSWTTSQHYQQFKGCNQLILHKFIPSPSLLNFTTAPSNQSCTLDPSSTTSITSIIHRTEDDKLIGAHLSWDNLSRREDASRIAKLLEKIGTYLASEALFNSTGLFTSQTHNISLGIFVGDGFEFASTANLALLTLRNYIRINNAVPTNVILQNCSSAYGQPPIFGLMLASKNNLEGVQESLQRWKRGECVPQLENRGTAEEFLVVFKSPSTLPVGSDLRRRNDNNIRRRDDCRTIQVKDRDLCDNLAAECGISVDQFYSYNGGPGMCSNLRIKQHVCCSAGTLPDFRPNQNTDGTCAVYYVNRGDICADIAASFGLSVADIESFNQNTWGFTNCAGLKYGVNICVSTGLPPMPVPIPGVACGPQKPGTLRPPAGTDWNTLNPCPLNGMSLTTTYGSFSSG